MKKLIILIILTMLITGCIKYKEELWINNDGSGKVTMKIGLPDMGMGEGMMDDSKTSFKETPGVKLISEESYKEEGTQYYETKFEFDFVDSLSNLEAEEESDGGGFIGDIELYRDDQNHIIFHRTIQFEKPDEESEGESDGMSDQMGQQMFDSMFSKFEWEYIVHFPYKIKTANTDPENIDMTTNTVKWVFPLSELSKNQTMEVVMEPPTGGINYVVLAIVAVIGLAIIGIIGMLIKKFLIK